jgi:hypothetical protein
MSPDEERALRDLARAGREMREIRNLDPQHRERVGATIGDMDWSAESALIKLHQWRNPKDVSEFESFVRKNFEPKDHIAIGRLNLSAVAPGQRRMQQAILPADELVQDRWQNFLKAANAHGQNIHISLNTFEPGGGRTKADVRDIRHVAIEIDKDGKAAVGRIAQSGPPPHHVIESSPGKFHVWWRVNGFDLAQAETATRGLIRTFGGDPAASDATRMLRAPGFTNRKPEYADLAKPHWVREVGRSDDKQHVLAPYPTGAFSSYMEIGRERLHIPGPAFARATAGKPDRTGQDRSALDWAWTKEELKKGRDPGSVSAELAERRPDKPSPKYYADHTTERALESIKREPQRGR